MSRFVEHFSPHESQHDRRIDEASQLNPNTSSSSYPAVQPEQQTHSLTGLQDLHISPPSPSSPQTLQAVSRSPSATTSTMSDSESLAPETWIASFCSLLGHEYFAEVSEDFIEDDFNLTGLQSQVPMYKEALEMILDVEPEDDEDDEDDYDEDEEDEDMRDENGNPIADSRRERRHVRANSDLSVIESSAELLYGLIHQRYITSRPGIQQMAEKYDQAMFGHCPRVMCNQARTLPVGLYDTPGVDTVKLFCPSCLDAYSPPNSRFQSVDGAFFGSTFGCLFFMTFPEYEISPRGDPMRLGNTHPIFTLPSSTTPAQLERANQSRSSSLTSNNVPALAVNTVPSSWLPPADQPTVIHGVAPHNLAPGLGPGKIYEPKIYGFRVNELAKTGPRMQWLRDRPVDVVELDEALTIWERESGDGQALGQSAGDKSMNPEEFYKQTHSQTADADQRTTGSAKSRKPGRSDAMDTNSTETRA